MGHNGAGKSTTSNV
ncbi:MAG: hypothetical protein ACLVKS_00700 [Peptococcus niger]